MTVEETGLDTEFRQQVAGTMATVLARLLERRLSSTLGLELLLQMEDELEIIIDVELMNADQMRTVGDMATFIAGHSRPG